MWVLKGKGADVFSSTSSKLLAKFTAYAVDFAMIHLKLSVS